MIKARWKAFKWKKVKWWKEKKFRGYSLQKTESSSAAETQNPKWFLFWFITTCPWVVTHTEHGPSDPTGVPCRWDHFLTNLCSETSGNTLKAVKVTVGFHQALMFWAKIWYLRHSDDAIEWQHGEAITVWTPAKLQAPEQILGKVFTYLDSIQMEQEPLVNSLFPELNSSYYT